MAGAMYQRQGGGFNFTDDQGRRISAASYAGLNGTDPWSVIQQMASQGDTGARDAVTARKAGSMAGKGDIKPSSLFWTGVGDVDPDAPRSTSDTYNTGGGYSGGGGASSGGGYNSAAAREAIKAAYNTKRAGMQGLIENVGTQQKNAETQVSNTYDTSKANLQSNKDSSVRNLDAAETKVVGMRDRSIRDLSSSVRNTMQAMSAQLGNFGAADSSGSDMTKYALAKMQSQQRGDILGQANEQVGEIDLKRADVEDDFNEQLRELDNWKGNQLLTILDRHNSLRIQIQQAMTDATAEEQMKLADLAADNDAGALADIRGLQTVVNDTIASIKGGIAGPQIDANKLKVEYTPTEIASEGVRANLGGPAQPGQDYTTAYIPREKRDQMIFG